MTGYFKIKTQNYSKIYLLQNFEDKMYKSKIATFCIALFIRVTEGADPSYKESVNKRSFLLKSELSNLPLFSWENSHFFLKNKRFKTPMILLSIFKVHFHGSQFILFQQKVCKIFGLEGRQISRLFIEKNATSFCEILFKKLPRKRCENLGLLFLKVNLIFSLQKDISFFALF